jgi:hypothetical protein
MVGGGGARRIAVLRTSRPEDPMASPLVHFEKVEATARWCRRILRLERLPTAVSSYLLAFPVAMIVLALCSTKSRSH